MTLGELKNIVNFYFGNKNINPEEVKLIITLEEMSIGPRAGTGVENIFMGFDWEHNQLRIEPKDKLIRYNKDRDIPKDVCHYKDIYYCSTCQHPLKKTEVRNNNYCPFCGQRLSKNINEI